MLSFAERRGKKKEKRMTEEAKKKGIEIAAGVVLGVSAWFVSARLQGPEGTETILFLIAYAALSLRTYATVRT